MLKSRRKLIFLLFLAIIILGISFWYLKLRNINNIVDTESKTTSDSPTAQEDFKDGWERDEGNSVRNEGTVQDDRGSIEDIPNQSEWTQSNSGAIVVYSPSKNYILKDGSRITGSSSTPKVSYRLIDDISGVISQGELDVVSGNFSGVFNFTTKANNGRLDIYNSAFDGTESNNVEIPVRFK